MLKRIWKNGRRQGVGRAVPSWSRDDLLRFLIDVAFTIWHGLVCAADSGLDASLDGCDDEYRRSVHGSVPLASRVSTRCGCELATRSCETRTSSWRECVATESLDRRNRPGTGTTSTGHEHTNTLPYSTSNQAWPNTKQRSNGVRSNETRKHDARAHCAHRAHRNPQTIYKSSSASSL